MDRSLEELLYGKQFQRLVDKKLTGLRKTYALSKIDLQLLVHLYQSGDSDTSKDMAERRLFTKGHISQSLQHLRRQELVETARDTEDRRRLHIHLTENARRMLAQIEQTFDQIYATALRDLSSEEQEYLQRIALKISRNIQGAVTE